MHLVKCCVVLVEVTLSYVLIPGARPYKMPMQVLRILLNILFVPLMFSLIWSMSLWTWFMVECSSKIQTAILGLSSFSHRFLRGLSLFSSNFSYSSNMWNRFICGNSINWFTRFGDHNHFCYFPTSRKVF